MTKFLKLDPSLVGFLTLLIGQHVSAATTDACAGQVPQPVRFVIEQNFPEFRLPRQSDFDARDISYNREHGGTGCLGIAKGSYRRAYTTDYAINITSKTQTHTILIVASQAADTWRVEVVRDWGEEAIGTLYVDTEPPGTYERTDALDGPITEPGERGKYTAKREGIVTGAIESTGAAFFFDGKAWVHVWISD
jgi:hypothetical protein